MSTYTVFDPDFTWDQLDKKTLARFARELMLCNQVHDRAIMPLIAARWGAQAMTATALDEWMGASPNYNRRNRILHGINGDGVDVIMKGFQLDIGAPHMWLNFHYDIQSHDRGLFWLTSCGAYNGVREMTGGDANAETQICVHMEDPTFDATVMAVNPGARCIPIYRPPHGGDIPAAGPCRWEVRIDQDIGTVEVNQFTELVGRSRAARFEFTLPSPAGDGLANYSGAFKRDFRLEDLDSSILAVQLKEFALDVHLLQRACYLSIQKNYGDDVIGELIAEHCAAMAPVYQARLRRLFSIEGSDMSAVLRLLQLDHHFVPDYVKTGAELIDARRGRFWIDVCGAIADGELTGVLTGLWQGRVLGLEQIVQAINPRAHVTAVPAFAGHRFCYDIVIDPDNTPVPPSPLVAIVESGGLANLDLSEHIYHYDER